VILARSTVRGIIMSFRFAGMRWAGFALGREATLKVMRDKSARPEMEIGAIARDDKCCFQ